MRTALLAAFVPLLAFSASCDNGDTIVSTSDCGLIRSDLLGTWDVTFPSQSTQLFNCSDASFNNKSVIIPSGTTSFNDVEVFASSSNVGFFFHNGGSPEDVFGNVETDSCSMLFSFLTTASTTDSTPLYLQCIGTLNRQSGIVRAECDSATVLDEPLTDPVSVVSDCDLTLILDPTVSIH